jgi:hypothetical protein
MGIAESLANYQPANLGAMCVTCKAISQLKDEDRDALIAAMGNPAFSNTALTKILNEEGDFRVGVSAFARHRRGECVGGRANK